LPFASGSRSKLTLPGGKVAEIASKAAAVTAMQIMASMYGFARVDANSASQLARPSPLAVKL
jgi:hypothetical protein